MDEEGQKLGSSIYGGSALLVGGIMVVLTGLFHPQSGDALLAMRSIEELDHAWYPAHVLGVGVWPILGLGFGLLWRDLVRRGEGAFSLAGFAFVAFAGMMASASGIFGGFVRPAVAAEYLASSAGERGVLRAVYEYNTLVNDTFADAYQVAFAVAMVLFSASLILVGRAYHATPAWDGVLGCAGVVVGGSSALAFGSGWLHVDASNFHVFVVANLLYAGWTLAVGVLLLRSERRETRSGGRPVASSSS